MKKNFKIVSLVLSMLLLVGAVIGITVSAENDPKIEITYKNLSYEGAVKTVYVVETENAEALTVKVNFYDADPAEGGELLYTKGVGNTIILDETEYDVVFSEGFRPKDLRASIFAVPTLVDANDAVVATGATVEYSPYIYAMNRFSQNATADQLTLYTALLDYGAAVQRVVSTPEDVAANGGYADEYYAITVNNAFATNLAEKTEVIKDTFSKAEIEAGAVSANATLDDVDFAAWADVNGNALRLATAESSATLTTKDIKPGRSTLTALYGSYGPANSESSDFTNGNPWGFIERTQNISAVPTNAKVSLVNSNYPGTSTLSTVDGTLVYNKVVIPVEDFGEEAGSWAGCNYQWWEVWFNGSTFDVMSAELDVTFTNVKGTGNFQLSMNDDLPRLYMAPSAEKDENGYSTYVSAGTAKLLAGQTYTLRVDWCVATCTLNAFVDGELVYTAKNTNKANVEKFPTFKFIADAELEGNMVFDNVSTKNICVHDAYDYPLTASKVVAGDGKVYPVCTTCNAADTNNAYIPENIRGNGKYYNDAANAGTRYDMSAIPSKNYYRPATQTWEINDGALSITSHDWAPMSIRPTAGIMNAVAGQKFVAEFDIMYSGSDNTGDGNHYVFSGLAGAEICSNTAQSPSFHWNSKYNNYMTLGNDNVVVANGVWYNFRYEYTVNADGSASYVTYVNDEAIDALSGTVATAITTCYGWSICGRVCGNANVNLDNMYLGVVCVEHDFVEKHHDASTYLGDGKFNKICARCGALGEEYTVTANGGAYFNNENATGAKADVGVDTITVAGTASGTAMTHGVDGDSYKATANDYAMITLRPGNPITPLPGEKLILEFDYMYEGFGGTDCHGFFGIAGADGNCSNGNYVENSGSAMYFYADFARIRPFGSTTTLNFLKGVWYNLRYEYTLNFDGTFDFALYVDDGETPFYAKNSVAVLKTTVYGIAFQGRTDSCSRTIRFDNFYMGVESVSEATLGTGAYYTDETKDGQRVDFTGATTNTTGEGNIFSGFHSKGASYCSFVTESLADGDNTIFRFTPAAWSYANLSANPNAGDGSTDNTTGVTVGTGDTLIAEFDFKYTGNQTALNSSNPNTGLKFEFNTTYNGSENNYFGSQIYTYLSSDFGTIAFGSGAAAAQLKKDVWYNIRFEYVVGTGGSIYVNDHKIASISKSGNGKDTTATTWYGLSIISRDPCVTFDMDNAYLGVIPAATE